MVKKYRLSIEITCNINEDFQGSQEQNQNDLFTRAIITGLLENPGLLFTYYRAMAAQHWLAFQIPDREFEIALTDEEQIWVELVKKIPPPAAVYLEELNKRESNEKDEHGTYIIDKQWSLIYDRVNDMDVTGWDFEEMKS